MDFDRLKDIRNMGFIKEVGFEFEIQEGYAKGMLKLQPKHMNPIGSVHGGVLFTMADTVGGTAATSRGRYVTTVSGNINFLRPAMNCEYIIGESREIKIGKKMCVYEVMITDERGKEIAIATMTYYYLKEITDEDLR